MNEIGNDLKQFAVGKRFGQESSGPRTGQSLPVTIEITGGDNDNFWRILQSMNLLGHMIAVQLGHHDIDEGHIEVLGLELLQGFLAVGDAYDLGARPLQDV